jgi:type I restriction enzyme S subunit
VKLPPYRQYKSSGVEWLGNVPEHWEVDRVKWTTTGTVNGIWGEEPNGVDDLICVRVADFDRDRYLVVDEPPTLRSVDEEQRRGRLLRKGDLLIEKSGGGEKQLVGCVVFFDHEFSAVCSNFIARMPILARHSARFWSYAHAALYEGRLNYPAIKQTTGIQNLDSAAYLDTRVGLPPGDEQHAIASFLDHEAKKIDTLVAKERTLIERLRERRTALISRTVTRGLPPDAARAASLDPHPKLKPSGVDWLGDVPQHWAIGRFSREVRIAEGQADPEIEPYASMLLIAPNHIESGTGRLIARETAAEQAAISGKYVCRAGEVVYSKIRPALAKAVLAPEDCLCSADMYPMTPVGLLLSRYLLRLLLSSQFTAWSVLEADRVAMPKVNRETLNELRLPVPPLIDQLAIVDFLDRETAKIDGMVAKVGTAIDRLQEYRTALITAAVTGKIDVRGAAA